MRGIPSSGAEVHRPERTSRWDYLDLLPAGDWETGPAGLSRDTIVVEATSPRDGRTLPQLVRVVPLKALLAPSGRESLSLSRSDGPRGTLALIGSLAAGSHDVKTTEAGLMSGVFLHANVIGDLLYRCQAAAP